MDFLLRWALTGPPAAQKRGANLGHPATKDNPLNDSDRFAFLMSQVAGKRLTYAQLTGKQVDALHHPAAGTGQEETF